MRKCLIEGAARFGWDKRTPEPRSMRDGRYLIGQGMAGAIYTHWRWPAQARVTLNGDGSALVEAGMHDIGTGTYTVMQQVAADALGLPPEKVTVRLGDTRLPASHASIGSATMANAGASVMLAAKAARDKAIELALTGRSCWRATGCPRCPPTATTIRSRSMRDRRRSSASPQRSPRSGSIPILARCA
jgi:xanthine dehydrogenase YagR molybdenum-binding subunit